MGSSREYEEISTRVLIIGAGAAGLRAGVELASRNVGCLLLGKRRHGDAHTRMAAGGINASFGNVDPDDRWDIHAADTLREGHFICQPGAVEILAREAPDRVVELQEWGCDFSVTDEGKMDQRYFGAQSFRRTCFVGDVTGGAILRALVDKARSVGVRWMENLFIARLLAEEGRVRGAIGFDLADGRIVVFRAEAVVLAAGGCTSMYFRSSSRETENTGDGMALAYEAGAPLRDMEFIQFHPTGMIEPEEMRGSLVTEAVRGEGGILRNARGERFMSRYSPDKMELDARDVVARANYSEIHEGRGTPGGGVYLDISHKDSAYIRERLPKICRQFQEEGIDITRQPMEVAPTAHYPMGGVAVDFETGATRVEGLYAIGEVTSGLHGANRLGGNSLAETVVFGRRVGICLAERLTHRQTGDVSRALVADALEIAASRDRRHPVSPRELFGEVRQILWRYAGIVREGSRLQEGLEKWRHLRDRFENNCAWEGPGSADFEWAMNVRFMLPLGQILLEAALSREESRGAHWRRDFPESRRAWQKNILAEQGGDGEPRYWTEDLPPASAEVQKALSEDRELNYHHLE